MLASLGIGAGFGLIAGLHQLGNQPARITPDVATSAGRGALVFFVFGGVGAVLIRFVHILWMRGRLPPAAAQE